MYCGAVDMISSETLSRAVVLRQLILNMFMVMNDINTDYNAITTQLNTAERQIKCVSCVGG